MLTLEFIYHVDCIRCNKVVGRWNDTGWSMWALGVKDRTCWQCKSKIDA